MKVKRKVVRRKKLLLQAKFDYFDHNGIGELFTQMEEEGYSPSEIYVPEGLYLSEFVPDNTEDSLTPFYWSGVLFRPVTDSEVTLVGYEYFGQDDYCSDWE